MNSPPEDEFDALAVEDEIEWPETTRQLAALYQIHGAIKLFHSNDLECSITLAGAAEGILPEDLANISLFKILQEYTKDKSEKLDLNFVQNWLKHGRFKLGDGRQVDLQSMRIRPFFAVFSIQRAITKFVAIYEAETPQMAKFMKWCMTEGYPGPSKATSKRRRPPRLRLISSIENVTP
jgi:hypothetical protein